jgi:hypothetical protein
LSLRTMDASTGMQKGARCASGRRWIAAGLGILAASVASFAQPRPAEGQETTRWERPLPAPTDAFELKVGAGYTQGFGTILPGVGIPHVAGAGVGVAVDADVRVNPHWSAGLQAEYQEFASELNTAARGLVGNLGATYHASPYTTADPWLRIGAGYRMLWSVDPPGLPTTMIHGFEIAKLTVGYDLRLSGGVAIAPVIGGDVNVFVWETANGASASLGPAQWGSFVFAGLQGRFDAGPQVTRVPVVANLR